jgi:pimeloyl-ACP methyl ester carboxylesterase
VRATREGGIAATRQANPHWSEEQLAARVEAHRQVSDRVMLDRIEDFDPSSYFDDLSRIAFPTLFVYGDPGYPGPSQRPGAVSAEAVDRARTLLPRGEFAFVERAGHRGGTDRDRALAASAEEVLNKPSSPAQFLTRVEELLASPPMPRPG